MNDKDFLTMQQMASARLHQLDSRLTYHNKAHTMDVLIQSERIARKEGVGKNDILLLKVAVLYHDCGFLKTYRKHEELSCSMFLEDAVKFDLTRQEEESIIAMILATKVPQQPQSLLEQVICDADLDYLGRDDFFVISDDLRKEFLTFQIIKNDEEWDALQFNFLCSHHYHTATSKREREMAKKQNMTRVR